MSDQPPSDVLGSLPRTRPHRRSEKRAAAPVHTAPVLREAPAPTRARKPRADRLRQPPQPHGTPSTARARSAAPPGGTDILGTAVQAAAELAEIGLSAGARAIRSAVSRLPRP